MYHYVCRVESGSLYWVWCEYLGIYRILYKHIKFAHKFLTNILFCLRLCPLDSKLHIWIFVVFSVKQTLLLTIYQQYRRYKPSGGIYMVFLVVLIPNTFENDSMKLASINSHLIVLSIKSYECKPSWTQHWGYHPLHLRGCAISIIFILFMKHLDHSLTNRKWRYRLVNTSSKPEFIDISRDLR